MLSILQKWFPLLPSLPCWCLDRGNKFETERRFLDQLFLISSDLFASCLDYHNAPNKFPGILFLKTNLSLALSCLKCSMVAPSLLGEIQTLDGLAMGLLLQPNLSLRTPSFSVLPFPSAPHPFLSPESSSSIQLTLQDLISTIPFRKFLRSPSG